MAIPQRYRWAVEILDVQHSDVILEVGGGYGHSIPLICEKLLSGRLTVIDRSEKMAAAASNREFIASGKAEILHRDLLNSGLRASSFDKIFLFNINVFWMDPRDELAEIRRLLKPSGRFYLFHQPPPRHDIEEYETAFRINLQNGSFTIIGVSKNESNDVRSLALTAKPIPQ